MKLISIDPGNVHVGIAVWGNGLLLEAKEIKPDEVDTLIELEEPEIVVVESFVVYPHKARVQTFSKMETPQLIGEIKSICRRMDIKLVEQSASVRTVAMRSPYASRHIDHYGKPKITHVWDAVLHGIYWQWFNRKNPDTK